MADQSNFAGWWEKESQRRFTKLECGLLGALFAAITIILAMALRISVG